jgi:hypothetical protein
MKKAQKETKNTPVKKQHTWGQLVIPTRRTTTVVCACGARYIKTRAGQTVCISCTYKAK